ncbi:MAG: putative cyclic di-GMP phosphodiesterase [Firmicutes bacterium]|nr:putative cyclic di-GMP phosphodiesterase [Bacillota bacterium]
MDTKILIVDDSATDRLIISNILSDCEIYNACDGLEAMEFLGSNEVDIIILDLNMPRMSGFEVLEVLRNNPKLSKIATLILTNYDETENEVKGLSLGAVDYIRKPLNIDSLRKRIEVHSNICMEQKKIEFANRTLEGIVRERTEELILTRDTTIHALIGLLEVRNIESCNHTRRTQSMLRKLCEHLSEKDQFKDILTRNYIDELVNTSPLHDIGKVGIPDGILLKPGKLDTDEFEIMKKHTTFGVEALSYGLKENKVPSFIRTAIEVAGTHHERFDGSGYPYGIAGYEIPLAGRLMAIVDVYDALTSERVYKQAYEHEYAMEIIRNESGKHFDPELVVALQEIEQQIISISKNFKSTIGREEFE